MRIPTLILGVILLIVGNLIAANMLKYNNKDKTKFNPIKFNLTKKKTPPTNLN